MRKESLDFFRDLIAAPSPSGFEAKGQHVVHDYIAASADEVTVDLHGNLIAAKNPKAAPRVMLAGHVDQIGMMIVHVTDEGYLRIQSIGGIDEAHLIGARVTVHGKKCQTRGIIGRQAIHILGGDERRRIPEIHDLWIDCGFKDKKEALSCVDIGDFVLWEAGLAELRNDLVCGPGFDDKIGAWAVIEALRLVAEKPLKCALYSVSTVQEELGLRGARTSSFGIDPVVGIAVDVTHATDYPGSSKDRQGDIKLGLGPVIERGPNINPKVFDLIVDAAKKAKIPYQIAAAPRATGTDANAMQVNRAGVAAGLISVPNRYMHSPVEVINLVDLENTAKLLAAVVSRITPATNFTPW
jgi:endoglucanase